MSGLDMSEIGMGGPRMARVAVTGLVGLDAGLDLPCDGSGHDWERYDGLGRTGQSLYRLIYAEE